MKLEHLAPPKVFVPITLTMETEEDVAAIRTALHWGRAYTSFKRHRDMFIMLENILKAMVK